jgi:hypothetical protein
VDPLGVEEEQDPPQEAPRHAALLYPAGVTSYSARSITMASSPSSA